MSLKKKANRNLPIEIESNILSWLPVKTLIIFRSVCKSWYSLISHSYFINLHRLHNQMIQKHSLLLVQSNNNSGSVIVVANTCSNERSIFKKPYPFRYHYDVVDSSNGLVCVYGQRFHSNFDGQCDMDCISLWNPALGINKIIYHRPISVKKRDDVNLCVGFGFHDKTNDYKVIVFTNDLIKSRLGGVEIYSLSSDSWRSIKSAAADSGSSATLRQHSHGVYISDAALAPNFYGSYCWLAQANEKDEARIISFDMGEDVFKEIMLPSSPTTKSRGKSSICYLKLFNLKDSLAVLEIPAYTENARSRFFYVWVMKEYNEPKSWTKLHKFDQQCTFKNVRAMGNALETELVLKTQYLQGFNVVKVLDVDTLQVNTSSTMDIGILKKASRISSFFESLVLLNT